MKTNWKTFTFLIIFTACISFFLTLTHLDSYYIPQIKSYILKQVRKEIQKNLPVHLEVQHISPTFFPLGLELHQIHIKPQPHVIKTLPSFFITKITGTIKLPPLLAGQIKLKKINIQDSKINYFYRTSTASSSTSPSSFSSQSFWKYLQKLPFEELSLEDIDISTNTIVKNLAFQINDFSLEAKIKPQIIHLNMSSNQASVENHLSYQRMDFSFRTQLLIDKNNLFISYFNITKQATSLNFIGIFK